MRVVTERMYPYPLSDEEIRKSLSGQDLSEMER